MIVSFIFLKSFLEIVKFFKVEFYFLKSIEMKLINMNVPVEVWRIIKTIYNILFEPIFEYNLYSFLYIDRNRILFNIYFEYILYQEMNKRINRSNRSNRIG
jgi:hypothetical protein